MTHPADDIDMTAAPAEGFPTSDRRRVAARGVIVNSIFLIAVGMLNLLKAFVVARFLSASEFGIWSIVLLAVAFITGLKSAAVGEKFIQQDEADQRQAFEKAFTLELGSAALMAFVLAGLAPLLALAYGRWELLLPALTMILMLFGQALQSPIWVYYRRMDFVRQRLLLAVDPIVGFIVTVVLAVSGAGYWSLVVGIVGGAWAGGFVALLNSPYRPRLRFERATLGEYFSFSWPLMIAVTAALTIAQLSVFFGNLAVGLGAAGAIGIAATYQAYTDRVDQVVTQALYPAVCRVVHRRELMEEVFVKSNRLALMWGVPFGVALTLFAGDLIHFGIGEHWRFAIVLFQVFGVIAAVDHIGFNWAAFYRAAGNTRPIAVVTSIVLLAFLMTCVPFLFLWGLNGFAAGTVVLAAVSLGARWYYVTRFFPGFNALAHSLRAVAPTLPAVLAVLAMRVFETGGRSLALVAVELAAYVAVTLFATIRFEGPLLREALSYVRSKRGSGPGLTASDTAAMPGPDPASA